MEPSYCIFPSPPRNRFSFSDCEFFHDRTTYAREKGGAYLRSVLRPVLKKIVSSHALFEMDPQRIALDPKNPTLRSSLNGSISPSFLSTILCSLNCREESQARLKKLCQLTLDAIFSRLGDFPLYVSYFTCVITFLESLITITNPRQTMCGHLYEEVNKKFPEGNRRQQRPGKYLISRKRSK